MQVFEFVIVLVVVVTVGRLIGEYLKVQKAQAKSAPDNAEKDARINALEERVQTLERIVTDNQQSLKDKINSL